MASVAKHSLSLPFSTLSTTNNLKMSSPLRLPRSLRFRSALFFLCLFSTIVIIIISYMHGYSVPGMGPMPHKSLYSPSKGKKSEAYVTALMAQKPTTELEYFFNTTRMLVFQLKHNPDIQDGRDVVVLVNNGIDNAMRDQLTKEGAIVKVVESVPHPKGIPEHYVETFTKLRVWELEEYSRIMFIDADTLVIRPLGELWDHSSAQFTPVRHEGSYKQELAEAEGDIKSEIGEYVLAAYRDKAGKLHPSDYFNSGAFICNPSKAIYKRLEHLIPEPERYGGLKWPEQNLLNWVFRQSGPMPWKSMPANKAQKFGFRPTYESDVRKGLLMIHEKYWGGEFGPKNTDTSKKYANQIMKNMMHFYAGQR